MDTEHSMPSFSLACLDVSVLVIPGNWWGFRFGHLDIPKLI
jgi:hypothetical protein